MPRTQITGKQVEDGTVEEQDLAPGSVTGPKLGVGALIGTDIQQFSDALLGVERITSINTSTTIQLNYNGLIMVDASSGPIILNLLSAASAIGFTFLFKKADATTNIISISAAGSDLIDSSSTIQLNVGNEWLEIKSDGTNWVIQNRGPALATIPATSGGMPGYFDPNVNQVVSITRPLIHYSNTGNRVKNSFLNPENTHAHLDSGIPLLRDTYLTSMVVTANTNTTGPANFHVRTVVTGNTNLFTVILPQGNKYAKAENIWLPLNIDDLMQVYLESTKNVDHPVCQLEICWR